MSKSTDHLVAALVKEGLFELAARAQDDEFHDFKSPHAAPIVMLVGELIQAGASLDLIQRAKSGEFDATAEESREWLDSPDGKQTMSELMSSMGPIGEGGSPGANADG